MGLDTWNISSSNLGTIHRIDGENNACNRVICKVKHMEPGWGETTCTLVSWRLGCNHPTRIQRMGWFTLPLKPHV